MLLKLPRFSQNYQDPLVNDIAQGFEPFPSKLAPHGIYLLPNSPGRSRIARSRKYLTNETESRQSVARCRRFSERRAIDNWPTIFINRSDVKGSRPRLPLLARGTTDSLIGWLIVVVSRARNSSWNAKRSDVG